MTTLSNETWDSTLKATAAVSRFFARRVVAMCCFGLGGLLGSLGVSATGAPTNEELYEMLLELKTSVQSVRAEAEQAKAEAANAKARLRSTERELDAARAALARAQTAAAPTPTSDLAATERAVLRLQPSLRLDMLVREPEVAGRQPTRTDPSTALLAGIDESPAEFGSAPSGSVVKVPDDGGGFTVSADFIYLRPSVERLDYAISDPVDGNVEPDPGSRLEEVEPDHEAGFRVGAGYAFPGSGLDLGLRYSRLRADASDSVTEAPGGEIVVPIAASRSAVEDADSARGKYELDYDVIDFELGQSFEVGSSVDLRIHGGLRYADLDQSLHAEYLGDNFSDTDPGTVDLRSEFEGIGPRFGAEGEWKIGGGFGLFGGLAASLLVGDFKSKFEQAVDGTTTDRSLKEKSKNQVVPVVEANGGFSWGWDSDAFSFNAKAGYHFENWFDVYSVSQFPCCKDAAGGGIDSELIKNRTDLGLQGPFLRLETRF